MVIHLLMFIIYVLIYFFCHLFIHLQYIYLCFYLFMQLLIDFSFIQSTFICLCVCVCASQSVCVCVCQCVYVSSMACSDTAGCNHEKTRTETAVNRKSTFIPPSVATIPCPHCPKFFRAQIGLPGHLRTH